MNKPRTRIPFMPTFGTGAERAAHNALFAQEAERLKLQWRCPDCSFSLPDGTCSQAWPNELLLREPVEILDEVGMPIFCKAFEALGH